MNKPYLVVGGHVISQSDGDRHYVNPHQLMRLYRLKSYECHLAEEHDSILIEQCKRYNPSIKILRPRYDGNYSQPTPREE